MREPIVFVSHFRIKEGKLERLKQLSQEVLPMLEADKPRTRAQLAYVDTDGTRISFVHVFPDADAMDQHVKGAEERSRAAYEFMDPAGWEIYGKPSDAVMQMMLQGATSAGVALDVRPEYVGGFLRM